MDDLDRKMDEDKRLAPTTTVGTHTVNAVVKGALAKQSKMTAFSERAKRKANETIKSVILPMAKDLAFNTLEDFGRRIIYRDENYDDGYYASPKRYNGYYDYSGYSTRPYTGSRRYGSGSRGYSTGKASQETTPTNSRMITLYSLDDIHTFEDEINRTMFEYGVASMADCYAAASMGNIILPTDYNVGFNASNNKDGIHVTWKTIRGRDEHNRPIESYIIILPPLEDLPR